METWKWGRDERHSDRKQPYIYRLLAKEYDSRRMTGIMRDHDASPSPRHRLLIMRQPAATGTTFREGNNAAQRKTPHTRLGINFSFAVTRKKKWENVKTKLGGRINYS